MANGRTFTATMAAALLIVLGGIGCSEPQADQSESTVTPPTLDLPDPPCTPTDQDQYVWRPSRLQVVAPCVRAVGTVMALEAAEADGDGHVHIRLDPEYAMLLTEGNALIEDYLIIEAVCQYVPPLIEALRICASDPDPYSEPLPEVGDHIWVEGRYVLDLWHHGWAELHPMYRWGTE